MRSACLWALLALVGCRGDPAPGAAVVEPTAQAIGVEECAACGMVVREQPAPRGQLVHRDGQRAHFCSVGDMVQYLRAPSRHGKVTAAFVEVLDPAVDPKLTSTALRPWIRAESAGYVVGVHREGIMGPPVLSYAEPAIAAQVAMAHQGQARTWAQLQSLSSAPHLGH